MISWIFSGDAIQWLIDPDAEQEEHTPTIVATYPAAASNGATYPAAASDPGIDFQDQSHPKPRKESFSDSVINVQREQKPSWFASNSFTNLSRFSCKPSTWPPWNGESSDEEICIADDVPDQPIMTPVLSSSRGTRNADADNYVIADEVSKKKTSRRPLSSSSCTTSTHDPATPTSTPLANVFACDSNGAFVPSMLSKRRVHWPTRGVRTPHEEHYLDVTGRVSVIIVLEPTDLEDRNERSMIRLVESCFDKESWLDRETVIVENHDGNPCEWLDKAARDRVDEGWLLVSLRSKQRLPEQLLQDIGVLMASGQYIAGLCKLDTFDDLGSVSARKTTLHLRTELLPSAP